MREKFPKYIKKKQKTKKKKNNIFCAIKYIMSINLSYGSGKSKLLTRKMPNDIMDGFFQRGIKRNISL